MGLARQQNASIPGRFRHEATHFCRFLYTQQGGTTHMKKLMGILLAASMVFSLAACGSTADTAASSAAGTTATAEGSSNNQAPDVKVGAIILGDETEGYSAAHINGIKEAAAELGMTERAVEGKLYRLKRRLRKLLGGEQDG